MVFWLVVVDVGFVGGDWCGGDYLCVVYFGYFDLWVGCCCVLD